MKDFIVNRGCCIYIYSGFVDLFWVIKSILFLTCLMALNPFVITKTGDYHTSIVISAQEHLLQKCTTRNYPLKCALVVNPRCYSQHFNFNGVIDHI